MASLDKLGDETLLRVVDVAHILSEDYSTSYRRVATGQIVSIRLGARSLRVRAGDLRAFLAARERRRDDATPTPWGSRHAS
ncbi:MAG: helix-turn-helix transcriptional regulator [Vulcanimicrobiaceae bacterium]